MRIDGLGLFGFARKEGRMLREGQSLQIGCLGRCGANQRQSYRNAHGLNDQIHSHNSLLGGFGVPMGRYVSNPLAALAGYRLSSGRLFHRGSVVKCEAIHVSIDRPKRLPSAAISTADPRFHMRIITVASRSWNRDNANAVTAATANPPMTLTSSGRSNAA